MKAFIPAYKNKTEFGHVLFAYASKSIDGCISLMQGSYFFENLSSDEIKNEFDFIEIEIEI